MRALGAAELLDDWERALTQPPVWRALALLAFATGETIESLAQLNIGRRDAQLLALHATVFGKAISAMASCPQCHETLELSFSTDDVLSEAPAIKEPLAIAIDDYKVEFRLPNSLDVHAAALSISEAPQMIFESCVLTAERHGEALSPRELPLEVVEAVAECMATADPQAEIELALTCPRCCHVWTAQFDIATFFWSELHNWAQRLLWEIHLLASHYGWCEADIMAMSSLRRQLYIKMVEGS